METNVKKIPDPPPRNPLRIMSIDVSISACKKDICSNAHHKYLILMQKSIDGNNKPIQSPMSAKPEVEISEMAILGADVNGIEVLVDKETALSMTN